MSEYGPEVLEDFVRELNGGSAQIEHRDLRAKGFIFLLDRPRFDREDVPEPEAKCEGCPVQGVLQGRAAEILIEKDLHKKVIIELMGEKGEALGEYLMSERSKEEVIHDREEICGQKEADLLELDEELEEVAREMLCLSCDCSGTRIIEDTRNGRDPIRVAVCDSEPVNAENGGEPNSVPAYVWVDK